MSGKFRTHYDNLGVLRTADVAVIKAAYKALAQKYHPDRNPDNPNAEHIMKIINTAYQVLIDPVRRAEHDRWIDEQEAKININQSTQNQNSQSSHQNKSNHQAHYGNTYTQNHQTQSSTNQHHNNKKDNKQPDNHTTSKDKDNLDGDKSSIVGRVIIPISLTIFMSRIFREIGVGIGFFGIIICYIGYNICYYFTYERIRVHKFIKEIISIIAGIIGIILVFCAVFMISYILDDSKKSDNKSTTEQSSYYQPSTQDLSQIPATTDMQPIMPEKIQSEPNLYLSELEYNNAVANINSVWNSLHPSVQEFLRNEQRAINKQREADCTAYGNNQSNDSDIAKAYRYTCEVPLLNERAEFLKTQLHTVITPPMQPQPLPETGATNKPNLYGDSPLQIKTNIGSHYWVKIVNAYSDKELVSYFIRGGETLDVNLPTGVYIIKYAYGDTWYGKDNLFGEDTKYSKADEILEFYYNQGYTIELIQQINGNLHTTAIDESQF